MRKDMKHKIVERPRLGGLGKDAIKKMRRQGKSIDEESDFETHASMRKLHVSNFSDKNLNENLNPLFRYLNKQAGRKWDEVYSEIREQINTNSATDLHILQHIDDIVFIDVIMVNGEPRSKTGNRFDNELHPRLRVRKRGSYQPMYVHPESGTLEFVPYDIGKSRFYGPGFRQDIKALENCVFSDKELVQYRRINGIWYEITFGRAEDFAKENWGEMSDWKFQLEFWRDCPLSGISFISLKKTSKVYQKHNTSHLVAFKKRQLNSREIKRLIEPHLDPKTNNVIH